MGDLINGSHRPGEMFGFDLDQLHRDSLGVSELVTRKSRKQYLWWFKRKENCNFRCVFKEFWLHICNLVSEHSSG